jgi:hypothetical protein
LADDLKSGALVPILDDFSRQQYSIDALYPHREHLPAKVRTFIDLLAKNMRQVDFDSRAHDRKRSNDPLEEAVSSSVPRPAPKQRTLG